ncbi:MAG: tetratricopeptide repeat protein [Spirochaetota bacterium]|nr:tetratricopeptide repeat protein [Spirochaetota bacterium]
MKLVGKFSYPDIFQRRVIYFNTLFTFITIGIIYSNITLSLKYYFLYQPIAKIVLLLGLLGLFWGIFLCRIIFIRIKKTRPVYILSDLLFVMLSFLFIFRNIIIPYKPEVLIHLFFESIYIIPLIIFSIAFMVGIKVNYFLKILCGDFVDDEEGSILFPLLIIIGIISGILIVTLFNHFNHIDRNYVYGILLLLIFSTIFIIKLQYHASHVFENELEGHDKLESNKPENGRRDDIFFKYLNFSYIIVYLFLGIESIIKYYGNAPYLKTAYLSITLFSIFIGFIIGRISRKAFGFIYVEMIYPASFLFFLILLIKFNNQIPFYMGILLFAPASLIFGFSLYHTIKHVISHYGHINKYNIINISLFLLPIMILISLNIIDITNTLYYALLITLIFMNIIFPGIYLLQSKTKVYKKAIYILLSLIVIPLIFLQYFSFNINIDNNLYINQTTGLNDVKKINANNEFIEDTANVYTNGLKIFTASDSIIKNMKRALVLISMYLNEKDRILFINGYNKFFKNPIIEYYNNPYCLDYIPEGYMGIQQKLLSDIETNSAKKSDILLYLKQSESPFNIIVDIPNLLDQCINPFRFSEEYYNIITKNLTQDGILIQIYDLKNCRSDLLQTSLLNLNNTYEYGIGFFFSQYLVVLVSRSDKTFKITWKNIAGINKLIKTRKFSNLFYSNIHLLSHLFFTDIDEIKDYLKSDKMKAFFFNYEKAYVLDETFHSKYISNNYKFLKLIEDNKRNNLFIKFMKEKIKNDYTFLTKLKETELFYTNDQFEKEIAYLLKLKRIVEKRSYLKRYISKKLSLKEKYYYRSALKYEKGKEWERAETLYKAILAINKDNFNANYRLGKLCITLQNLDESFLYLQHTMKLRKNDPKVLYQMGVLLFSRDRPKDALVYLERAKELKGGNPSLFLYTGLCHEKLGDLDKAKLYYEKASTSDPNDIEIASNLKRVEGEINAKKERWKPRKLSNQTEVEEGENIPLPINESAIEVRNQNEKKNPTKNK